MSITVNIEMDDFWMDDGLNKQGLLKPDVAQILLEDNNEI